MVVFELCACAMLVATDRHTSRDVYANMNRNNFNWSLLRIAGKFGRAWNVDAESGGFCGLFATGYL